MSDQPSTTAPTALLGPQRFSTTAGQVARSLTPEGRIATITAGWRERESEDAELHEVLEARTYNLRLYTRLLDVIEKDEVFALAARAYNEAVDELAAVYSTRVQRTLDTVYALERRHVREEIADAALEDGIRTLQSIDEWYLRTLDELTAELDGPIGESELVAYHRTTVRGILEESAGVAITGGHVGVLLRAMGLFVGRLPDSLPTIAWSAGAMVLTDRVVLYNDSGPQGFHGAEVWGRGLGRVPGVLALPHARRRIKVEDPMTVQVFVRRFAPAAGLLLDDGARVVIGPDGVLPEGAKVFTDHGTIGTVGGLP
jgi:hypothetical protein